MKKYPEKYFFPDILTHYLSVFIFFTLNCCDTVFLYNKDKELILVLCKIPTVSKSAIRYILSNCIDVDKYQFIEVKSLDSYLGNKNREIYYLREKKTGEVFRQKILIPDYKDKKFIIIPDQNIFFHENGTHFELDLIELKRAYRENKLGGKLKELVATLNELEDNNVFMLIDFK